MCECLDSKYLYFFEIPSNYGPTLLDLPLVKLKRGQNAIIFKFTTRAIRCHSSLTYLQEATCGSFNNIATEDSLRYAMELVDLFLVDKATVILLLPRCG